MALADVLQDSVLARSGATLAIAQGLAAWLRARRGVTVTVERDSKSGSLPPVPTSKDLPIANCGAKLMKDEGFKEKRGAKCTDLRHELIADP